ncbi:MAG: hypothetical protein ABSH05_09615 [Bryobacteraceae bacterium]|jgi:hypothetical protein
MSLNLDELRTEILKHLESQGFVVFHGYSRLADTDSFVAWDVERKPDYQGFLETAKNAGVRLIVYHWREFSRAHMDEAAERLEDCDVSVEEQRGMEKRLRELSAYEGFTCALELSFDLESRVYLFNLRAEWYEEYLDLLEEIDAALPDEEDEEDDSIGGYYSRN